jgi:superfamily II DNA or RNA helicase/HKD family nuclease
VADLERGVYEHLITQELADRLRLVDDDLVQRDKLDPADADELLARHIAVLARRALRAVPGSDQDRLIAQVALANRIADSIAALQPQMVGADDQVADAEHLLAAIIDRPAPPTPARFPARPTTPLSTGALLVNGHRQPRIGHEVAHELDSADQVDLLCAFIKWGGLLQVQAPIRELIARGGRLRVITTTYLGATDQRALDRLAELGADIKISYETRTTRLHAKAWLFRRGNNTSTAYVGSSNLSRAALVDGLEWNVRISELEQPHVIRTFDATFTDYWNDPGFEDYRPDRDADQLARALRAARWDGGSRREGDERDGERIEIVGLDVRPYPYQREILDDLAAERAVHGRHRNLVVMATGTGKTVVAALDYNRLRGEGIDSLLFVAHRREILQQSRSVFRHVLRDGSFGETLVAGSRPQHGKHVFASIQSLDRLDELGPDAYDMVIVDEFHHAAAPTYRRLLDRLHPRILLGLTATPDRADGEDIRGWFDGRTAVELHVWEALDRQLLAPFQYFGLHDDVDLSRLRWKRGQGYEASDLDRVYTGNHARARTILQAVRDIVDLPRMRALGFCVSVGHAEFMADWFVRAGVPAAAVTSRTDLAIRDDRLVAFKKGELRVLFNVDLFNEGVDLPMVDTILMLRPTESATIFLQQLGRGLRLDEGKACLTVLDFIGGQHTKFRFDLRWRALTGISRRSLAEAVTDDFPTLPSGCHIQLDRVAKKVVLDNLRAAVPSSKKSWVAELRQLGDVGLADFLAETGLEIEDLYRSGTVGGWVGLRRLAGLDPSAPGPDDRELSRAYGRMLHLDDPDRLDLLTRIAGGGPGSGALAGAGPGGAGPVGGLAAAERLLDMVYFSLWGGSAPLVERDERLARLRVDPARRDELRQLADVLRERIHRVTPEPVGRVPLRVHARYSRNEACAAFGMDNPSSLREGVKWLPDEQADLFFVTLVKAEHHFSPTTMYQDRAITDELFQWESQSTTSSASATGQRYIQHAERGSTVHLFVRETKVADGSLGAPPYLYAGPMTFVSHTGDRPMRILWQLRHPLPADVFSAARVIAA